MLEELEGRVAVITGGGSGIGAALARACAGAGMRVVVVDVDQNRADDVAEAISDVAPAVLAVAADVADSDSMDRLAEEVYGTFGATHLLCNNAGVSPLGVLWDFAPDDWAWVLGVNVIGVANGIRSFVPRMIAQGDGGHIVNTASAGAFQAKPRLGAYTATKHAVLGLSDCLRLDLLPYGIGVSVLCPGGVDTNIAQSMSRPSSADPTADLATDMEAFLAGSDEAVTTLLGPDRVASLMLLGVLANQPYIITAPGQQPVIAQRCQEILDAHDHARDLDPTLP